MSEQVVPLPERESRLKGFFAHLGLLAFAVYNLGFIAYLFVFEYESARSHGLLWWATVGQVVTLLKAFFWPYFAFCG